MTEFAGDIVNAANARLQDMPGRLKSASFARRECSWLVTENALQWCRLNWHGESAGSPRFAGDGKHNSQRIFDHIVSDCNKDRR